MIRHRLGVLLASLVLAVGLLAAPGAADKAEAYYSSSLTVSSWSMPVQVNIGNQWQTAYGGAYFSYNANMVAVFSGQCIQWANAATGGYWQSHCHYGAGGTFAVLYLDYGTNYVARYR